MMEDDWSSTAKPTLLAVADLEDEYGPSLDEVVAFTGLERKAVAKQVRALIHGDYLSAIDVGNLGGPDYINLQLLPAGLSEVGSWPLSARDTAAQEAYDRLLAELTRYIEAATPTEKAKAVVIREAVLAGTVKAGVGLLVAWAKEHLGLGGDG